MGRASSPSSRSERKTGNLWCPSAIPAWGFPRRRTRSSMRSLPRSFMGSVWDCPSAAPSLNRIAAACGLPTTLRTAQVFTSVYPLKSRHMTDAPVASAALCALGIFVFVRQTRTMRRDPFDGFGFAMLSLGVGSLQLMLDRRQLKDWFHSTEIWIEATVAGLCFYLLAVHTMTAGERSFLNRELLKSPNFVAGSPLMFGVGMILTGSLALVPSMMQVLLNYPVFDAGWMMAPRGFGTMLAMFIVARMINRFDNRLHLCAAQPLGIVGPAAPHPDPGNRIARADAHARRQHRHRDPRNRAQPKHADRPFPPDGAPAPGQPAGPAALPLGPVQPDRPLGDRCAQPRSHPPSRDDRLQRRFRLDADRHPRLIALIAAGPHPAPPVNSCGGG